jgi:hypothetical protein
LDGDRNNQGDVVDLRTASGRGDLLARIEKGKTDFRVRCAGGQIMQQEDLLTAPYPIYSFQSGSAPRMVGPGAFALPSDVHPMNSRSDEVMLGIYRLKEGDLTFVFAPPGEPRPAKLVSNNGTPTFLMDFKRQPKD